MYYNPIYFIRCLILCLAGYAVCIPLVPFTVLGEDTKSPSAAIPKIDHILLEVSNLNASIAFYRDFLGLRLKSQSDWFVKSSAPKSPLLTDFGWVWLKRSNIQTSGMRIVTYVSSPLSGVV